MSAQSRASGVYVFVVGRDTVKELRTNCRSGNCGFREGRGGGKRRKRLGGGWLEAYLRKLGRGIGAWTKD